MWRIPDPAFPTSQNSVVSFAASLIATAILIRTVTTDLVPDSVTDYLNSRVRNFTTWLSSNVTVVIDEFNGLTPNQIFECATVYLGSKLSTSAARIKASKPHKENEITFTVDKDQELVDFFQGVKINWVLVSSQIDNPGAGGGKKEVSRSETRYFELSFRKKYKDLVLRFYLPYIVERAEMVKNENKTVKLYTVDYSGTDYWSWVNLNHPASFDTIAMDSGMKRELIEDLDLFVERKEYYKRVGRAWKRGYLFYGPPGTGKSSLVAAMANYLKFDVYDLDLREVQCNSDLRRLLIGTANRSILVIEDIDCSIDLQNRELTSEVVSIPDEKVSLSGLLNFIDGLWSSCGDERIIVFTTNHKDRLDPALLRPGRMDMHFHLSYCTFHGFKTLAYSYLKIEDHALFRCIEELLGKVQATPAEVAGELMKGKNAELTLQGLIKFLQSRDEVSLQKKTSSAIENS